jgi:hypothetical protein
VVPPDALVSAAPHHGGGTVTALPDLPARLRAALTPPGGPPPELRESHCAWVLLTADRAYKLKKPVRYAFLDYGTPRARRTACEAEDQVNRDLAAPIMLGVRGLRREDGAVVVADADDPRAVDWIVLMRRFDEDATLAALVAGGAVPGDRLRAAAQRIAAFHAAAERVADPDPAGRVAATMRGNLAELEDVAGPDAAVLGLEGMRALLLGRVAARAAELDARAAAGLVRDGHGDLRAEHVVFTAAGVLVIDRIEFDPALRRIDVADDLSFLLMDLEALGAAGAARRIAEDYAAAGGEAGDAALLALFGAHRALVRAKVALLRDPGAPAGAHALAALGARLAWRARGPLALLVSGPPASGKSTLAAALAARSGLPVLSSDLVRKEALGLAPGEPAPDAAYDPAARAGVYAELGRRARAALEAGGGTVVDATFGAPDLRRAFLDGLGAAHRVHARALVCAAPPAVLAERAARPRTAGSDAGPGVARRLARAFTPVTELPPAAVLEVDGTAAPAAQLAAVEAWPGL